MMKYFRRHLFGHIAYYSVFIHYFCTCLRKMTHHQVPIGHQTIWVQSAKPHYAKRIIIIQQPQRYQRNQNGMDRARQESGGERRQIR